MDLRRLLDTHIFDYFNDDNLNLYKFLANYYENKDMLNQYFNLQNIKYNKWGDYKLYYGENKCYGKFNIILTMFLTDITSIEVINLFYQKLKNFNNMYEIGITDNYNKNDLFCNKNIRLNIFCKFDELKLKELINFYSQYNEIIPDNILNQFINSSLEFKQILNEVKVDEKNQGINFINLRDDRTLLGLIRIQNESYVEHFQKYNNIFNDVGFITIDTPFNEFKLKMGNYNYIKFIY
jgi:hypothetical protein